MKLVMELRHRPVEFLGRQSARSIRNEVLICNTLHDDSELLLCGHVVGSSQFWTFAPPLESAQERAVSAQPHQHAGPPTRESVLILQRWLLQALMPCFTDHYPGLSVEDASSFR